MPLEEGVLQLGPKCTLTKASCGHNEWFPHGKYASGYSELGEG